MNVRPSCPCGASRHRPRRIAVTGGPGAGKTALLEVVQRQFCEHVVVLPEAAAILFTGGFPRQATESGRRAVQRAIYHVEVELERMALEEARAAVVLCDRGTIDGAAYWPGPAASFWADLGTSAAAELARYAAVIHLRTPPAHDGYVARPPRTETVEQAHALDEAILAAWSAHPARTVVDSQAAFIDKLRIAIDAIRAEVPPCCQEGPP